MVHLILLASACGMSHPDVPVVSEGPCSPDPSRFQELYKEIYRFPHTDVETDPEGFVAPKELTVNKW